MANLWYMRVTNALPRAGRLEVPIHVHPSSAPEAQAYARIETERHRHKAALAAIEDETRRRQIETSNTESHDLALVKQMSAALGALKVHELNLGDASLSTLMRGLRRALGNSKIKTDP